MNTASAPTSVEELVDAVRSTPRLIPTGGGTKPRLSAVEGATRLSMTGLRGIIEYEPAEFTFTALAGTPVREISAALAERGQYLPFDPMLLEAGATLGGTVASGLSGPGRFRFGGLRDFILGVRFVDGSGRLLRMGGKVVKNAAGFDLPKFFVGSAGRFGVLAELTFKVFPQPAAKLTLKLAVEDAEAGARVLMQAANTRWEADALDLAPENRAVYLRLAGPEDAIEKLSQEIITQHPGEPLAPAAARQFWSDVGEFRWAHPDSVLLKTTLTPDKIPALCKAVGDSIVGRVHVSAGGNVAYVELADASDVAPLDKVLSELRLSAVTLRGNAPLWCGVKLRQEIAAAVRKTLDPDNRFPGLDD